jgi:peptidyl-tRNA hydrolase
MLKSEDFLRVRIGVENRENRNIPGEDYVLRKYTPPELDILTRTIKQACEELLPLILN